MIQNKFALQCAIEAIKAGVLSKKNFMESVADIFEIIAMSVTDISNGELQPTLSFLKPIQENPTLVGIEELKDRDKFKLATDIVDILVVEAMKQKAEDIVVDDLKQIKLLMK